MPPRERNAEGQADARPASRAARRLILVCFFLSGFAAVLYQTVWMRIALARFGVNTSIVAAVLSVFMLGLMLGSASAARALRAARSRLGLPPLRVYALAELAIGAGGIAVPLLLDGGRRLLLGAGASDGAVYTIGSLAAILAALLPFCVAMGSTYPAAIAFLDEAGASGPARAPFGALYLANVGGAVLGAALTPVALIESFGFRWTSIGAAAINAAIAVAAGWYPSAARAPESLAPAGPAPETPGSGARKAALFVTGFTTMGMEVLWTRMYPTLIGTFVYSFAAILTIYLLATAAGAAVYRRRPRQTGESRAGLLWPWLGPAALLPLLSASTTLPAGHSLLRVALGLAPFCALLGYVTPALIDDEGGDDPARVGLTYAINLLGCLLGPLAAGFVLLPAFGTRWTAVALALPLFLTRPGSVAGRREWIARLLAAGVAAAVFLSTTLFEDSVPAGQVRYDHVATVVAAGTGTDKRLFVNGVGMTNLVTKTKMMGHFPAAHLAIPSGGRFDALVICFGMGTTFRSLASWGADVTAVELVPSVTDLFAYFFPDGPRLLAEHGDRLRVVHDDGRRFLDRTPRLFDLITTDPPPPVEAAGSSLLYSKEFCDAARRRMKPGAILQVWIPGGDRRTIGGVAAAIASSFPHVRVFPSVDGDGLHFLASDRPIAFAGAAELARRLPEDASRDLVEWTSATPVALFSAMLSREYNPASLLVDRRLEETPILTDDRPLNEFYMLRRLRSAWLARTSAESKSPRDAAGPP